MSTLPEKRTEEIVVVDTKDEVLVYDLKREKAHHLNRTAAIVWRYCDGRTDTRRAAEAIGKDLGIAPDEELVTYALERLDLAHLLKEPLPEEYAGTGLTRRQLLQRFALLGLVAVLVPTIVSLVPPSAAQAAGTCVQGDAGCIAVAAGNPCYITSTTGCTACMCKNVSGWKCKKNANNQACTT